MSDLSTETTGASSDDSRLQVDTKIRQRRTRRLSGRSGPITKSVILFIALVAWWPLLTSPVLWTELDQIGRTSFKELDSWTEAWAPGQIRTEDPITLSTYFWEQSLPLQASPTHRAINLGLHLLAVALLLALLESLRVRYAWIAALFFAVHPAAMQALFWPGYRPAILGLALTLGALFLAVRNRGGGDYGIALMLAALACIVHPAAYSLPLILALVITLTDYPPRLDAYNRVIPFVFIVLLAALAMAGRGWAGSHADAGGFIDSVNTGGLNLVFYLQQTVIPLEPALFYNYSIIREGTYRGDSFLPFLFLLPSVVLVIIFFKRPWARALLLGLGSFIALAAPGLFSRGYSLGGIPALETHGLYPALPAAATLFVAGTGFLLRKIGLSAKIFWPGLAVPPAAILFIVSTINAREVSDEEILWRTQVQTFPEDGAAREALAFYVLEHPETVVNPEDTVDLVNSVLEAQPGHAELRMQLARLYRQMNQTTNAVREYRRVLRESEPESDILREAADFFYSVGLAFDARNALDRIEE